MKTPEEAMTLWLLDEIPFDGGYGVRTLRRGQIEGLLEFVVKGNDDIFGAGAMQEYVISGVQVSKTLASIMRKIYKAGLLPGLTELDLVRYGSFVEMAIASGEMLPSSKGK